MKSYLIKRPIGMSVTRLKMYEVECDHDNCDYYVLINDDGMAVQIRKVYFISFENSAKRVIVNDRSNGFGKRSYITAGKAYRSIKCDNWDGYWTLDERGVPVQLRASRFGLKTVNEEVL